jgi:putative sterol carrier protein
MTEDITGKLITQFSSTFSPEKADGINATIQIKLSGEQGGNWYLDIHDQDCQLIQGEIESPSLTLESDPQDFKDIVSGKLDPAKAFMSGRLKFRGNMLIAMKLASVFGRPESA